MGLTQIKASTQDGTSGTPVAKIINEDSSDAVQAVSYVGSKTTWSETSRTGITTIDTPTGGDLTTTGFAGSAGANLFDCGNALTVSIRATCNTASATLSGFIVFYDVSNNPIGKSETITFVSDATLRLGNASGDFVCQSYLIDAGATRKARFFISSVSGGTWAIYARPI